MLAEPARPPRPMKDMGMFMLQQPGAGSGRRGNVDAPAAEQLSGVGPEILQQLLHITEYGQ
ncbi:hypothetical protein D3C75_1326420 [compost metagenome]